MAAMLDALRAAAHPVALTGAGISAPSGVPTFQSLWKGRPIRDFLGRSYYERDPIGFFALYCAMEAWCRAEPNAAHRALAALGFADFRVRLLDGCARLQLTEAQLPRALACRQQILAALAPLFDGVLLDLNSRAASQ